MAGTYRSGGNSVANKIAGIVKGRQNEKKATARAEVSHKRSLERIRTSGDEARKTMAARTVNTTSIVKAQAKAKVKVEKAKVKGRVQVIEAKKGAAKRKKVSKDNKW